MCNPAGEAVVLWLLSGFRYRGVCQGALLLRGLEVEERLSARPCLPMN